MSSPLPPARLQVVDGNRLQVMVVDNRIEHIDVIGTPQSSRGLAASQILYEGTDEWLRYDSRYNATQEESQVPDQYSRDGYSQKHQPRVESRDAQDEQSESAVASARGSVTRTTSPPLEDRHAAIEFKADLIVHISDFFASKCRAIPVELARAALEAEPWKIRSE